MWDEHLSSPGAIAGAVLVCVFVLAAKHLMDYPAAGGKRRRWLVAVVYLAMAFGTYLCLLAPWSYLAAGGWRVAVGGVQAGAGIGCVLTACESNISRLIDG